MSVQALLGGQTFVSRKQTPGLEVVGACFEAMALRTAQHRCCSPSSLHQMRC